MNIKKLFVIPLLIIFSAGCSSLMLHSADYSWPIENVLKVDDNGFVTEDRHTFTINVKPLFFKEFADSNSAAGKEIISLQAQDLKTFMYFFLLKTG